MVSPNTPASGETTWPPGTLLQSLTAPDRRALIGLGTRRTYRPGQALINEGSRDADIFVLLHGCAKVLGHTVDGRCVLLSIRIAGDLVGELAALDDEPRSASVVAATGVVARAVTQQTFLRYLGERAQAAKAIHGAVVGELRRATRYRLHINAAPIAVRLALVLDHLVRTYGRITPDGVHIEVPLTESELASLIGVSEPSLHRALTDLRTRQVIRTGYRHMIVSDPAALAALAAKGTEPPARQ